MIVNRLLQANEAMRLTAFVTELYGDSYPNDIFYDPAAISHLIDAKRLYCCIAEQDKKTIVGHLATYFDAVDDLTADGISGMVSPHARGNNIMSTLANPVLDMYNERKLAGLHLYAVTRHTISQRKSADGGAAVTGVLMHDWPGQYQVAGFDEDIGLERMAIVTLCMPFCRDKVLKRRLFFPSIYRTVLANVYQKLGFPRFFITDDDTTGSKVKGNSQSDTLFRARQQTATLRFTQLGQDWDKHQQIFMSKYKETPALYIDLPLTDSSNIEVCEQLINQGWYYGAVLPERCGTDFLRMQLKLPEPDWQRIAIIPEAQPFLALMPFES